MTLFDVSVTDTVYICKCVRIYVGLCHSLTNIYIYIYIYVHVHICTHTYVQAVLNGASFNPTAGCRDTRHCSGKGGLLAFMEVPAPACSVAAWDIQTGLSGGEIAGIVIGCMCGMLLTCALMWMCWKRA
jgi:hypothetical protein